MITLDDTIRSLEIALGSNVATSQSSWVCSYIDKCCCDACDDKPFTTDGTTNNTTAVAIMPAPDEQVERTLRYFSLWNDDTAAITITVQYNDNGTLRVIFKASIASGYTLVYNQGNGWAVYNANGAMQYVGNAGANGVDAFTTTTADFTQPAVSSNVTVSVNDSSWMAVGQIVYINDSFGNGGYYTVWGISSGTSITLTNLGYTGSSAPTNTIHSGASVVAAGVEGATGADGKPDKFYTFYNY